jgi:integrase
LREAAAAPPELPTLSEYAAALFARIDAGLLLNRNRQPYKPSARRGLEAAFRNHIEPALGDRRLDEIRRQDVQDVMDGLRARGLAPSTVRDALKPLLVVYRTAIRDEIVPSSPCVSVELDRATGKRQRVATPAEAAALLEALPLDERALWATAFYAGLRQGELAALRWSEVNLDAGVLTVAGSYDFKNHVFVDAKSVAGQGRRVAAPEPLKRYLQEHRLRSGRRTGLVFGRTADAPFTPTWKNKVARRAWLAAGMTPITMHECRHSFASFLVAAGANVKDVQTALGHVRAQTTLDVYAKLLPGRENQLAAELERFLSGT